MVTRWYIAVIIWTIINKSNGANVIPENWPTTLATCATVDEDETDKKEIFNAESHCDDKNVGDEKDVEYRLASSTPPGPFKVKDRDGKIETLDNCYFDYSLTQSYVLNICAWDEKASDPEYCGDVHICVIQKRFPPAFTNLPATISIPEDFAPAEVYDANVDKGPIRVFFIDSSTPANAPFIIRRSDGKIQRIMDLDYETETQYVLTIGETDNFYTIYEDLIINILDVNEPPQFEDMPGTSSVYEIEVVDRLVYGFKVVQEDSDAITATMTTSPAGGPFRLDFTGDTGQIFLDLSLGSIDAEAVGTYTLTVTASDTETTIIEDVVVTIVDVNEAPEITNLPRSFTISEALVTGYDLMTVAATDPDGDALSWFIGVSPHSTAFEISAGGVLKVKSNPGFDFEMTNSYSITVYVDDGDIMAMPQIVTITITDANESPILSNLPASANINENSNPGKTVFKVRTTDPDAGDTFTYSMSVSPSNLPEWFEIDSTGLVTTTSAALLDYEAGPVTFTVTVTVQDAAGLSTSEDLTVNVLNKNEKPTFSQSSIGVTIDEEIAIGTHLSVALDATDPDAGDTVTYSIPDLYETRFVTLDDSVSPPKIEITGRIDYEHPSKPHSFTIPVIAQDSGFLMDIMNVEITVNDIDDNSPVFEKNSYTTIMSENSLGGHEVITVIATDADSGDNAKFTLSLQDGDNTTACTTHFTISSSGLVFVKKLVDAETQSYIICDLLATSPTGLIGESTLYVTIADANDNRPYFVEPFFSFEAMADAQDATAIGKVEAKDNDISESGRLSHSFLSYHNTFMVEGNTGVISTKSPLPEYETFTFYGVVEDNMVPKRRSDAVPIRVDTYLGCECLINVEVAADTSSLMAEPARSNFLTDLKGAASLNNAVVKIVFVNQQHLLEYEEAPSQSVPTLLTLLWTKVGKPDDFSAMTKTFYKADELLSQLTISGGNQPSTNFSYTLMKIERYQNCPTPPPVVNWWLDTPEGNFTIFLLSLLGLAVLVALIVGLVLLCRKLADYIESTRPIKSVRPQHGTVPTDRNKPGELFDFRYNPNDKAGEFRTAGSTVSAVHR